jgi:uncharacterized protein (TIGR02246 family)
MKAIRVSTTLAAFLLLSFSVGAAPAQPQSGNAADEAAIKQLIASNTQAFNQHDAHGVAADYAEDADFTNMRGASQHSRKNIEAFLTPLFATGALKNANRTLTVRSVRFLAPTIAEVDIDSVLVGTTTPDGKENPPRKGLVNDIVSKQNGKWMITVFHELDYPEAPAPPAGK